MLEWGAVCKVLLGLYASFSSTGAAPAGKKTGLLALALRIGAELKVRHVTHLAYLMAGRCYVIGPAEVPKLLEGDGGSNTVAV